MVAFQCAVAAVYNGQQQAVLGIFIPPHDPQSITYVYMNMKPGHVHTYYMCIHHAVTVLQYSLGTGSRHRATLQYSLGAGSRHRAPQSQRTTKSRQEPKG